MLAAARHQEVDILRRVYIIPALGRQAKVGRKADLSGGQRYL
jgi:hypothetical protein